MCTYSISLKDELISETRRSFDSEAAMDSWLQQQVEALLVAYNTSQQAARRKARLAIAAMRRQSEENGNAAMTLDDINNEIRQARKARKAASLSESIRQDRHTHKKTAYTLLSVHV